MIRFFAAFLVTLLTLSSSPVIAADTTPYDIHVVLSKTGPAAFLGFGESQTLTTLEGVINHQGGINGRPVHFVFEDDQSNSLIAVQSVTRLSTDSSLPLIIGPGFVATCAATIPITVNKGPVTWCFAPGISPPAGSFYFATGVNADDTMRVMLRYLRERHWTRIAILSSTDASGQAFDKSVVDAMAYPENKEMAIVDQEHMNPSDISALAQATRAKASNPQVVLTLATGTPWGTLMRGVSEAGITVPVMGGNGNMVRTQLDQYKSFLPKELYFAGPLALSPESVGKGPIKDAQSIYFKAYSAIGVKPDLSMNIAWDPGMLLINGLRKLGPNATARELRDYVLNLHGWAGINGIYDFRDGGQRGVGQNSLVIVRWNKDASSFEAVSRPSGYLKQ